MEIENNCAMPLIHKLSDSKFIMGLWSVEEDLEMLLTMVDLNGTDKEKLNEFNNPLRKIEWLSVRVLLKQLLNYDAEIYYNENRKPFLKDCSHNISISHSHKISSVILSRDHFVGIDLEHMTHRIGRISGKFINNGEYITSDKSLEYYHLYIHWCAKEALYKICDKTGLNFKTNILIDHFEPEDEGVITGHVNRGGHLEDFRLNYFKFENYIVVWCMK